jgi:UDP-3-O-acyl-N-acetylglucosamine deacetylase
MKVRLEGLCLNGGFSRIEISGSKRFTLHLHIDSRDPLDLAYDINNVSVADHMVSVGGRHRLKVVEHLFSALYGLNLFNVKVDAYGDEIPFFDGSSIEFVSALEEINNDVPTQSIRLKDTVVVDQGDSSICYMPHDADELILDMSLDHAFVGNQRIVCTLSPQFYKEEIAPARTFVFTNEDDPRLRNLPPYGIGITKKGIRAASPLRFPDEPVRHKLLDLLGDLYVLKTNLHGKVTGRNTSHHLNLQFVRRLILAVDHKNE